MTNDDRKLLESAARAMGGGVRWDSDFQCFTVPDGQFIEGRRWNPLESDGDALRLAVKLKIHPETFTGYTNVWYQPTEDDDRIELQVRGDDPYAATRRAIVVAAAKIGEQG